MGRTIAQLVLMLQADDQWRRRKHGCTRDPKAGPGSCWFWWESCPDKTPNCYRRWERAQQAKEKTSGDKKI